MSHVLVVDDKAANLAYIEALLTASGLDHQSANNGAVALDLARRSPPLVVIADLLMPIMDGYALLRFWKADEDLKKIPFIVYTATYIDGEDEQLAADLGADAFINKSVESHDLIARVRQVIRETALCSPASPKSPVVRYEPELTEYNEALVRKLEAKTVLLNQSNQALQKEIVLRGEIAATQIAVLDALTAQVVIIDAAGVIVAVNGAWRRFTNLNHLQNPDGGVGANYLSICDRATGIESAMAPQAGAGIRAVLSGESHSFELEYPCSRSAERTWFRMVVTPLHRAGAGGAVIMHVDVTERRSAEQRRVASEAQFLLLLNSTAEGIYRLDMYGECTFCNTMAARLLGYHDPSQVVGRFAHQHHHHSRPNGTAFPAQECPIHRPRAVAEGSHADDAVFFRADGTQFPVEYWSYPILEGQHVAGTVVTFLDITQRRNLEAQFLQSQKMEAVGSLAGGVAHDFNNALQVILTYAELLEVRLIDDAAGSDEIRQILSEGRRAASLTRQLLALSRKELMVPVLLDLSSAIGDIEEMLRRTIGEDITMTINSAAQSGAIKADLGQIQQILINLTVNARDAMPRGGRLVIDTSNLDIEPGDSGAPGRMMKPGRYAVLSVCDTGQGMDAATRARIFEPFFTTKGLGKGTGLGLSTVYGIVKQSQGYIFVDSEVGKGTRFTLYFPIVPGVAVPIGARPAPERPIRGTETVLVVEDEEPLRAVLERTLTANGYTVIEARDGNAAIRFAHNFSPVIHLLLTDVILPGVSGKSVADRLAVSRPAMKVIYMSGYTDDFIAHHGVLNPGIILLEKPFSVASLLLRVRETLDTVNR